MRLSASQLETFDPSTPFGCNRKWWWKYVKGVASPPDKSQQLGIDVHKSIENYIKGDDANCLHPIAINAKEHIEAAKQFVGDKWVENKITLTMFGHDFVGVVDYLNDQPELLDWKTTSDINKYAKNGEDLPKYIPLIIYAQWYFQNHPGQDNLMVALVYLQTKGKKSARREWVFTRAGVQAQLPKLEALVRQMEVAATKTEVDDVEGDYEKCNVGRGCSYSNLCHGDVMSLFERFGGTRKIVIEDAVVVPPDAPASNPVLAADPVPSSPPVPETPVAQATQAAAPAPEAPLQVAVAPSTTNAAKRGPGRPRKAVSTQASAQPKSESTPEVGKTVGYQGRGLDAPSPIILGGKPAVTRRALSVGMTVNLGNYESARVEVTLETESLTMEALAAQLKGEMEEQLKPFMELKAKRLEKTEKKEV